MKKLIIAIVIVLAFAVPAFPDGGGYSDQPGTEDDGANP